MFSAGLSILFTFAYFVQYDPLNCRIFSPPLPGISSAHGVGPVACLVLAKLSARKRGSEMVDAAQIQLLIRALLVGALVLPASALAAKKLPSAKSRSSASVIKRPPAPS